MRGIERGGGGQAKKEGGWNLHWSSNSQTTGTPPQRYFIDYSLFFIFVNIFDVNNMFYIKSAESLSKNSEGKSQVA